MPQRYTQAISIFLPRKPFMKTRLPLPRSIALPLSLLVAAILSFPVQAQPGSGTAPCPAGQDCVKAKRAPGAASSDCAKSRNPQRCEARKKASELCQDKSGAERRRCHKEAMPPDNCAKARHPARCEAMHKAQAACQDKFGPALRQCIESELGTSKP